MTAPVLQMGLNGAVVEVFWEVTPPGSAGLYRLYLSSTRSGPYAPMGTFHGYPNYGKDKVKTDIPRRAFALTEASGFYLVGTYTAPGDSTEGPRGEPRFIPPVAEQAVSAGAANSPLTVSERFKVTVGLEPVRQTFSRDVKQLEVFNLSKDAEIYVDVTGLDASTSESMPVMPYAYYALGVHILRSTGLSIVSVKDGVDVRIVAHY